jgi:hypothetical protein
MHRGSQRKAERKEEGWKSSHRAKKAEVGSTEEDGKEWMS